MNSKYFAPFVLIVSAMLFGFVLLYAVVGPRSQEVATNEPPAHTVSPAADARADAGSSVDVESLPAAIPAALPGVPPTQATPTAN